MGQKAIFSVYKHKAHWEIITLSNWVRVKCEKKKLINKHIKAKKQI